MKHLVLITLVLGLSACDRLNEGMDYRITEKERALNVAKLIAPEITASDDARAYQQATYQISRSRRLLMMYDGLLEEADKIAVDAARLVKVRIHTVADIQKADMESLHLCPMTRSWMMLATWKRAHPFGNEGKWTSEGGDFLASECLPLIEREISESDLTLVEFDATDWFHDHPEAKNENFGFVLLSDSPVMVRGDSANALAPRFLFFSSLR